MTKGQPRDITWSHQGGGSNSSLEPVEPPRWQQRRREKWDVRNGPHWEQVVSVVPEVRQGGHGKENETRSQTSSRVCRFPLVALCRCDGSPVVVARTGTEIKCARHGGRNMVTKKGRRKGHRARRGSARKHRHK